jgi:hypothetical protein
MDIIWIAIRWKYRKCKFGFIFAKTNLVYIYHIKVVCFFYKRTRNDKFKTELIKNFSNDILPLFENNIFKLLID